MQELAAVDNMAREAKKEAEKVLEFDSSGDEAEIDISDGDGQIKVRALKAEVGAEKQVRALKAEVQKSEDAYQKLHGAFEK